MMGLASQGVRVRSGDPLAVAGQRPAGIAIAGQIPYRYPSGPVISVWEFLASVNMPGATTTGPIDTTGANLIIANVSFFNTATAGFSDSEGNIWTPTPFREQPASALAGRMFYCINPQTSTAHRFINTDSANYAAYFVAAFKYSAAIALDQTVGINSTTNSISPPSVNPAAPHSLFVTGVGTNTVPTAISSGFNITGSIAMTSGQYFGGGMAYWINEAGSASAPTWSLAYSTTPYSVATMINFIPAP